MAMSIECEWTMVENLLQINLRIFSLKIKSNKNSHRHTHFIKMEQPKEPGNLFLVWLGACSKMQVYQNLYGLMLLKQQPTSEIGVTIPEQQKQH